MDAPFLLQLASLLIAGGAIYGAIRSDMRNFARELGEVRDVAVKAHDRIDVLLTKGTK